MLTSEEATIRVARGAAHLDQVRPGWFNRIDVGTLTLSGCSRCVLGQLVGDFWRAVEQMWPKDRSQSWTLDDAPVRLGFVVAPLDSDHAEGVEWFAKMSAAYQPLQDAWIAEIATRQCGQGDNEPARQPEDVRGTEVAGSSPDFLFAPDSDRKPVPS